MSAFHGVIFQAPARHVHAGPRRPRPFMGSTIPISGEARGWLDHGTAGNCGGKGGRDAGRLWTEELEGLWDALVDHGAHHFERVAAWEIDDAE